MINTTIAQQYIKNAEDKANELGVKITTCVVDEHGTIVMMRKMDEALFISPKFAYAKAFTAAVLKIKTSNLGEYVKPGNPYFGLNTLFEGELTSISGGVPIVQDGTVVGAIGVGGSADVKQDEACAENAIQS